MAWEWSHTPEAYDNAREHVMSLPRKTLLTVLREWAYEDRERKGTLRFHGQQVWTDSRGHKHVRGFRLPAGLRRLPQDILADLVWQRAEKHATCDNGGWNAWVCPYGCHTVPFDPPKEG